jgi:monovalent cation:H+ antiporter-2, CPA2 family
MHGYDLILTLTCGLAGALVLGYVTQRLRLSPIVGYLLAGVIVGPYTPGFVANHALAEQLADIGIILLMFGVGLQFHVQELLAVRRVSLPGALLQSSVATGLGVAVGVAAGWTLASGVVFGLALSVSSTVVLIRVLSDTGRLHTAAGHVAVGWLVVEDILTVIVLVVMPVALGSDRSQSVALGIVLALGKVALLVAATAWVGDRAIPWALTRVARTQSRELFTLAVLALALGIAVVSAAGFGVSMPLGAFLAGLVVGRSEFGLRAASDALPMRDAFAVLFFVSVGMLLDPWQMIQQPGLIAATVAIILIGKPATTFALVKLFRQPTRVALLVAASLSQIGEFSFIVATLAHELGAMTDVARNAIVGAAIISITANPFMVRVIQAVARRVTRTPDVLLDLPSESDHDAGQSRAVVVGYGPVGRAVVRLLSENEVSCTVVEMNIDTVRALQASGMTAVHGDASREDVLRAAGTATAATLVISIGDSPGVAETLRLAKAMNPKIKVMARAVHLRDAAALRACGVDDVFSGEGEVAMALTAAILRQLGATPDQVDRERMRVQSELS